MWFSEDATSSAADHCHFACVYEHYLCTAVAAPESTDWIIFKLVYLIITSYFVQEG
jgi:hypothetical protein